MKLKQLFAVTFAMIFSAAGTLKAQEPVVVDPFYCPVDARTFMIGTTLGFSTSSASTSGTDFIATRTTTGTQLNIGPRLGYFFMNNFVAGMGMDFSMVDLRDPEGMGREHRFSQFIAGPYARLYFPVTNLAFFGEISSGFGGSTVRIGDPSNGEFQDINTFILGGSFGPGISIFSAGNMALESMLKYNITHTTADIGSSRMSTTINALDIVFGIHYYVGASPHRTSAPPAADPNLRF